MKKLGSDLKKALLGSYVEAKSRVKLTPGKAIRIYREAQGFTQNELALAAGLTQATLSALESDRISLGIERAQRIARALKVPDLAA